MVNDLAMSPARSASQAEADGADTTDTIFKTIYYKFDELENLYLPSMQLTFCIEVNMLLHTNLY
jgi:hypothetical protein